MGKTAAPKKKGQSVHSRAAKRASSPSIDTDKSLKNIKPPVESTNNRPSVLAVHQGAGVSKKSKNGRKSGLSSKAKRRQEKAVDRAEAVMDRTEGKIEKSRGKARTVQDRAKAWEEHNRKIAAARVAKEEALEKMVEDAAAENEEERTNSAETADVSDVQIIDAPSIDNVVEATSKEILVEEEDEIL
ncbi:MAG: hypothetical protein M1818_003457 [Claussenomyces sp. TS43310]|nr:MAG: hypothetical protein M1818_003457 [Claussenomyces sp. TS43310]